MARATCPYPESEQYCARSAPHQSSLMRLLSHAIYYCHACDLLIACRCVASSTYCRPCALCDVCFKTLKLACTSQHVAHYLTGQKRSAELVSEFRSDGLDRAAAIAAAICYEVHTVVLVVRSKTKHVLTGATAE
eukprot:21205-Heterococcus_DN1.PRE.1